MAPSSVQRCLQRAALKREQLTAALKSSAPDAVLAAACDGGLDGETVTCVDAETVTCVEDVEKLNILELYQLETTNGALKFPGFQSNPPTLLGRTMYENSNMDGLSMRQRRNNFPVIYGDLSQFVLVDRIGSTVEIVSHLFGSNRRPTGQRGALLRFRTGSAVVVPQAFRREGNLGLSVDRV